MHIGERIKAIRKKRVLTQQDLAEAIGKGTSTLQKYELGIVVPKRNIIESISKVLNVSPLVFDKDVSADEEFEKVISSGNIDEYCKLLENLYKDRHKYLRVMNALPEGFTSVEDGISKMFELMPCLPPEYDLLNSKGKEELNKYIKYLATQEEYTVPDDSDHEE